MLMMTEFGLNILKGILLICILSCLIVPILGIIRRILFFKKAKNRLKTYFPDGSPRRKLDANIQDTIRYVMVKVMYDKKYSIEHDLDFYKANIKILYEAYLFCELDFSLVSSILEGQFDIEFVPPKKQDFKKFLWAFNSAERIPIEKIDKGLKRIPVGKIDKESKNIPIEKLDKGLKKEEEKVDSYKSHKIPPDSYKSHPDGKCPVEGSGEES